MVAFNFKAQFADDVESGRKRQTIRAQRRASVGDQLQLYTGMRTKKCRKLRDAICATVHEITIDGDTFGRLRVIVDREEIRGGRLDEFVAADGFARRMDMRDFFAEQYGLPFSGWLTRWE